MNNVTLAVPETFAAELVRRGLPVEYAQRTAAELADHRVDLASELEATGMDCDTVAHEVKRRLGDESVILKKTVREYQQRHWCARWPLITFLLAPIPSLIIVWYSLGILLWLIASSLIKLGLLSASDADTALCALPADIKYVVLVSLFLLVPATVMYFFGRLARRAALGWTWIGLVACLLGLFVGDVKWERIGPGSQIVMRDRQTLEVIEQPQQHDYVITLGIPFNAGAIAELKRWWLGSPLQIAQLLLPSAVALGMVLHGRRLAQQAEQLRLGGC
jgi:hypothetical protein